ncbi:NAD-binding protein [Halogeometricum sp. S1BR25-6]|uniref:NAD-binding protein n=1 Tax=Halogeometricum salsisoli TaxID=2950536 RepID=A0ABU2GCV3_9EURY|nr:NAD-binding protein [Halogeometricum sp. S1BR25-6]MDS0298296.1 NAD-binding protein [Halogeometricum sp. S1BR25-6]
MTGTETTQPFDGAEETAQATHYVLGGAHVGTAIAERLRDGGHRVVIVDESYESRDIPGVTGDPAVVDVLSESGVESDSTVVVATRSDRRNLLIAQLVRARFDGPRVIAFVNDPERRSLFTDAGHESFCVTTTLSDAVGEVV